jgi:RHS repeat-associated protein
VYGQGRIGIYLRTGSYNVTNYVYELSDHLGNVRATFRNNAGNAEVLSYSDYYPQGSTLPGRNYISASSYKYAYQGQEVDNETGFLNFELRQYDARIGRWFNPDPMGQHYSPYLAMGNNPVNFVDPDGGGDLPTVEVVWYRDYWHLSLIGPEHGHDYSYYSSGFKPYRDPADYTKAELEQMEKNRQENRRQAEVNGTQQLNRDQEGLRSDYQGPRMQAGVTPNENWLGSVLIAVGVRIEALKPVAALGSKPGSSIASTVLSKTLPIKMPFRIAGTTNLGRMLGRTLPFVPIGVVMTALSIEDAFREISPTFDFIIGMRDFKMGMGK